MASNSGAEDLSKKIKDAGDQVRNLKTEKAAKVVIFLYWLVN